MSNPLTVLMVHNRYRQRGGEDVSFEADVNLLREHGHRVLTYELSNTLLESMNLFKRFARTVWSFDSARDLANVIRRERPTIMHLHNTFPLISPSACYSAASYGVPVVQKLSNYRLLCPNALFLRDGKVCELCLHRSVPWPSVCYACYRASRPATAAVALMLVAHRCLGTWKRRVNRYIALSDFVRDKFIEGGWDQGRIAVRANFLNSDPGCGENVRSGGLFVGMLQPWKGADILLRAWLGSQRPEGLGVVGRGPQETMLRRMATDVPSIRFTGELPAEEVYARIQAARFLIFPSITYETFGRTMIEAFACGTPVVASRIGPAATIVQDGRTGLHFEPGDVADLARKLDWAFSHPDAMTRMGQAARKEYERRYTAGSAYSRLMEIYREALAETHHQGRSRSIRCK